jgi:alanyl-tRNA synthetase
MHSDQILIVLLIWISSSESFMLNTLTRRTVIFHKNLNRLLLRDFSKAIEWPVDRVRSTFIDYFEKKWDHVHYRSSPVVPYKDNSIIFANAGMNQFKSIFTGTLDPGSPLAGLTRAVNSQKCIRAGGKHNDLDDVGKDTYHHTFFEMLGTWSFGNYFKKEAIDWAYDLLVGVYGLKKEQLYASYFGGDSRLGLPCDDEAKELWLRYLPPERVLPFDAKANFWEMGEVGPCGPCSEIHYDRIGGRNAASLVNMDDPDVIEIWNLVFMQYNRDHGGALRPLPAKHIDTGMGLERLTSIMQNKRSNYDTDVFTSLFEAVHDIVGGEPYRGLLGAADTNKRDFAFRVIADHARTLTFSIGDGAVPSNEGRGYVVRRILRRAARYAHHNLHAPPNLLSRLVPVVVDNFKSLYPELAAQSGRIAAIIAEEEKCFSNLLVRGVKYFNEVADNATAVSGGEGALPGKLRGDQVFHMYDTLGFPVDLTQIMAAERGLAVDLNEFQQAMDAQKERSRQAETQKRLDLLKNSGVDVGTENVALNGDHVAELRKSGIPQTRDEYKYNIATPSGEGIPSSRVLKFLVNGELCDSVDLSTSKSFGVILSSTSFYAEAGGQAADCGSIRVEFPDNGNAALDISVIDTQSAGGYVLHTCVYNGLTEQSAHAILRSGTRATPQVSLQRRERIVPNHTLTHVLNFILRKFLGEDVQQRGSSVTAERLRFDFSTSRALQATDIASIEQQVNAVIGRQKLRVYDEVVPLAKALEINGIRAVFGETYPDPVRVVSIGVPVNELIQNPQNPEWVNYSVELCGGTHAFEAANIGPFVITETGSVAKGVRRITAVCGADGETAVRRAEDAAKRFSELSASLLNGNHLLPLATVEVEINRLKRDIEESLFPASTRLELKVRLDKLSADVRKRIEVDQLQSSEALVKSAIAEGLAFSSSPHCAGVLRLSSDSISPQVARKIIDEIKKKDPRISLFVIFRERNNSGAEDKISCVCSISQSSDSSFQKSALDWVSSVVEPFGGKGGGRNTFAQGSLTRSEKVSELDISSMAQSYLDKII